MKKRSNGYWKDFNTLKEFLLPICNNFGRMITYRETLQIKGLNHAIGLHGGMQEVAKKLGFNLNYGFKTLSGNFVKSSYEVILDNFLFLNEIEYVYEDKILNGCNYLFDFKVKDFFIEIWGYRRYELSEINAKYEKRRKKKEGVYKLQGLKLISLDYHFFNRNINFIYDDLKNIFKKNTIKTNDFYSGDLNMLMYFENYGKDEIINEMIDAFYKLKVSKFPSKSWWKENGFKKHISFLDNNNITISYILEKFDIKESNMNIPNKFKDINETTKEIENIYEKTKKFPTQEYLKNNNPSLLKAIYRYHKNLSNVALYMKITNDIKPKGYWMEFDNLKKEMCDIIKVSKKFPTTNYLREIGRDDMISAIYKYYGGILNVKKLIDIKN